MSSEEMPPQSEAGAEGESSRLEESFEKIRRALEAGRIGVEESGAIQLEEIFAKYESLGGNPYDSKLLKFFGNPVAGLSITGASWAGVMAGFMSKWAIFKGLRTAVTTVTGASAVASGVSAIVRGGLYAQELRATRKRMMEDIVGGFSGEANTSKEKRVESFVYDRDEFMDVDDLLELLRNDNNEVGNESVDRAPELTGKVLARVWLEALLGKSLFVYGEDINYKRQELLGALKKQCEKIKEEDDGALKLEKLANEEFQRLRDMIKEKDRAFQMFLWEQGGVKAVRSAITVGALGIITSEVLSIPGVGEFLTEKIEGVKNSVSGLFTGFVKNTFAEFETPLRGFASFVSGVFGGGGGLDEVRGVGDIGGAGVEDLVAGADSASGAGVDVGDAVNGTDAVSVTTREFGLFASPDNQTVEGGYNAEDIISRDMETDSLNAIEGGGGDIIMEASDATDSSNTLDDVSLTREIDKMLGIDDPDGGFEVELGEGDNVSVETISKGELSFLHYDTSSVFEENELRQDFLYNDDGEVTGFRVDRMFSHDSFGDGDKISNIQNVIENGKFIDEDGVEKAGKAYVYIYPDGGYMAQGGEQMEVIKLPINSDGTVEYPDELKGLINSGEIHGSHSVVIEEIGSDGDVVDRQVLSTVVGDKVEINVTSPDAGEVAPPEADKGENIPGEVADAEKVFRERRWLFFPAVLDMFSLFKRKKREDGGGTEENVGNKNI